jgi:hypothetical protein
MMLAASFFTRLPAPHPQSAEAMAALLLDTNCPSATAHSKLGSLETQLYAPAVQHADNSFACLGKESEVVAANEQRNPHSPPLSNYQIFLMKSIVYP